MQGNGNVKVLMSCNFNNVEVSRPLAPDATDEEYRSEFNKALRLCQEQIRNMQEVSDVRSHFLGLQEEYLFVKQVAESVQNRGHVAPVTAEEAAAIERYNRLRQFCFEEHTSSWDWEDRLDDGQARHWKWVK